MKACTSMIRDMVGASISRKTSLIISFTREDGVIKEGIWVKGNPVGRHKTTSKDGSVSYDDKGGDDCQESDDEA